MSERPTSGPAPQYGEYAPIPTAVDEPAEKHADPAVDNGLSYPPPAGEPTDGAARRERPWDRALTIGLLALGGLNLLWSIPQFANFAELLDTAYSTAGYGDYTNVALAAVLGPIAIIAQLIILVAAVAAARARLRRGRVSFWIPLVAGAIASVVVLVILVAAMFNDPALMEYVNSQMTSTPTPAATP